MSQKIFKEAFLHIGLGKTGTTTIQHALLANARLLEQDHNLHFPSEFKDPRPFHGNHSLFMASLFGKNALSSKANVIAGYNTASALAKSNKRIYAQFIKNFEASNGNRLLLSAERVGHFGPKVLIHLRDWISLYADKIYIVVCVRHPASALSSHIQQRLKTGLTLEELYQNPPYYRLQSLFERLETVFGRESIIAYDFAKATRGEGGVVTAFLHKLGVKAVLETKEQKPANTSMSHEAALLLSALNRQRPMIVDGKIGRDRTPMDVHKLLSLPGRKYQAPAEVYERLEKLSAPHLFWAEKHYRLKLEAPSVPKFKPYAEFSPQSIDALALIVAELSRARKK